YHFEYGTGADPHGSSTPTGNLNADDSTTSVNAGITGLAAGTTYTYRLVAHNATGTTSGSDHTLTTSGTPPPPGPVITTGAASGVGQTSATLNGTIDPNGQSVTYHFDYGPTVSYGFTAPTTAPPPVTGSTSQPVSAAISGLSAGTTYHYRLAGSPGGLGGDRTFTTASPPAPPPPPPPGGGTTPPPTTTTTTTTTQPPPTTLVGGIGTTVFPALTALSVPSQKLGSVLRNGLKVVVTCSRACNVAATLSLASSLAKKLHLSREVTIGRGSSRLAGTGTAHLTVKLSSKARRALARVRKVKVTLRVSGRAPIVRTLKR
ncbi:MAG: hypothetical protein ACJ77M_13135, partial [Thermoleophilaceae bacterium]